MIDHLEADRRQFSVIDTECYVGGLAALAVHDATNDWQDDVEDMADAVASQRWTSISCDGDGAGVDAGTLVRRIRDLLESGGELVTLLYTSAVPAETLADVHRALAEDAPGWRSTRTGPTGWSAPCRSAWSDRERQGGERWDGERQGGGRGAGGRQGSERQRERERQDATTGCQCLDGMTHGPYRW